MASEFSLPRRKGERPQTGESVPQLQQTQTSPTEILEQLARWAFSAIQDVREEPTRISVPSTRALWLDESVPTAHDDAFMPPPGGREFAHIHADGSLHLHVSDEVAREVHEKAWGQAHPLDPRSCMAYAPRDEAEIDVIKRIVLESYGYATGKTEGAG